MKTTTRERYTLLDALSSTGGFLGILNLILSILLSKLQETLFYRSLISNLYFTESKESNNSH